MLRGDANQHDRGRGRNLRPFFVSEAVRKGKKTNTSQDKQTQRTRAEAKQESRTRAGRKEQRRGQKRTKGKDKRKILQETHNKP